MRKVVGMSGRREGKDDSSDVLFERVYRGELMVQIRDGRYDKNIS